LPIPDSTPAPGEDAEDNALLTIIVRTDDINAAGPRGVDDNKVQIDVDNKTHIYIENDTYATKQHNTEWHTAQPDTYIAQRHESAERYKAYPDIEETPTI
jgi:hypothetical protein